MKTAALSMLIAAGLLASAAQASTQTIIDEWQTRPINQARPAGAGQFALNPQPLPPTRFMRKRILANPVRLA